MQNGHPVLAASPRATVPAKCTVDRAGKYRWWVRVWCEMGAFRGEWRRYEIVAPTDDEAAHKGLTQFEAEMWLRLN
jgi:hypothetical protein